MKKGIKNIMRIIGIIQKICNINKIYYKLSVLIFMIFMVLSCRSQDYGCGYSVTYDSITNKNVYTLVDYMPAFLGKEGNIVSYICKNYNDPSRAGVGASFLLRFVIDKEGYLIGAGIVDKERRKYEPEEKQIIDIVETSPKWKPGVCKGKKVDVLVKMRFRFTVDENGRLR